MSETEKSSELTKSTDTDESSARPKPQLVQDVFTRPDMSLQDMADFSSIIGIGVTLYLPWGTASGDLVNGDQFFDWIGTGLRENVRNDTEEHQEIVEIYAKLFDRWSTIYRDRHQDDEYNHLESRHIHLKNAACATAGPISVVRHDFLRVKLADVSAWSRGVITYG